MTSFLFEDPTDLIIFALLLVGGFGILLAQSRRGIWLIAMGIVLAMLFAMVMLEQYVVTDLERVEDTVRQITKDLERDDAAAVLNHVDPDVEEIRRKVEAEMRTYKIDEIKITELNITINAQSNPATAEAKLRTGIQGRLNDQFGGMQGPKTIVDITARFRRKTPDGPWLLYDYECKLPFGPQSR
ncbi:MAG: hypothetical protein N2C14_27790 [Planctomycetales bacterium]